MIYKRATSKRGYRLMSKPRVVRNEETRRRRYNRLTSRMVARWSESGWLEELYRKKNGEYFLYVKGEAIPDGIIRPIQSAEAEDWMVKKTGKSLKALVDDPLDKPVLMSFHAPTWMREALRNKATDERSSIGAVIVAAVREYLGNE